MHTDTNHIMSYWTAIFIANIPIVVNIKFNI